MLFDDIDSKALCDECVRIIDAYVVKFATQMRIDPSNFEAEAAIDASQNLVVRLFHQVYSINRTVTVPATWWDALKERWFPRWALRRWPAKQRILEARALLPDVPVEIGRHRVSFAVWEK